jgi:hypothetical protein
MDQAKSVSKIKGLTVQEIFQDPNGPRLCDVVDEDLIEASMETPIQLDFNLRDLDLRYVVDSIDSFLEKLIQGRFILRIELPNVDECVKLMKKVHKVMQY